MSEPQSRKEPSHAERMAIADECSRDYRNALRELSKTPSVYLTDKS
jgi:hypothetical protein